MTRPRPTLLAVALASALAAGCGDSSSPSDFDSASVETLETADFCSYRTYQFQDFAQVPGEVDDIPLDQLAESQALLVNAITGELEANGLDEASVLPDLEVNVFYQFTDELIAEESCGSVIVAPGQVVYSCDWVTVEEYEFGTAVIDLVERAAGTAVLRGVIQGAATGNDTEERIDRLVAEVFDAFEREREGC